MSDEHKTATEVSAEMLLVETLETIRQCALTVDEAQWIFGNPERCAVCGHLEIFHEYNEFNRFELACVVNGCECEKEHPPQSPKRDDTPMVMITLPKSLTDE